MKDYDPRMHSAEHILNQTMDRMFHRGRSFSAHIEKKKSKCDYYFDRMLTDEEVREVEQRVNEIIQGDLPVREQFIPRNEAAGRFVLDRLPGDAGDSIRIITIGDYDACPCIGTHVSSTGEIGTFRIISADYRNGVLRIRFRVTE